MKQSINFWNWFINNHETLKNFHLQQPRNRIATLNKLDELLHSDPLNLDYVIVLNKSNPTAELIITTNGNNENFKAAIKLIKAVPKLEGWMFRIEITSKLEVLNTLNELDDSYILGEITLETDCKICIPLHAQNSVEKQLFIYYKNHQIYCNKKNINHALFVIIEKNIGKNTIAKQINFIQLAQKIKEPINYTELYDFEYYLDICKKRQNT